MLARARALDLRRHAELAEKTAYIDRDVGDDVRLCNRRCSAACCTRAVLAPLKRPFTRGERDDDGSRVYKGWRRRRWWVLEVCYCLGLTGGGCEF